MKTIGSPPRPSGEWDVPLTQLADEMRALKDKAAREAAALKLPDLSPERFQWLTAHPQPAPVGERLEYRHLLHDEDPDSTVPAFRVDLTKHTAGGQS